MKTPSYILSLIATLLFVMAATAQTASPDIFILRNGTASRLSDEVKVTATGFPSLELAQNEVVTIFAANSGLKLNGNVIELDNDPTLVIVLRATEITRAGGNSLLSLRNFSLKAGPSSFTQLMVFNSRPDQITSEPTLLDYKTVRDNFGKKIGDSFLVVQLNIRNTSENKQLLFQDAEVKFDPGQCNTANYQMLPNAMLAKVSRASEASNFNEIELLRREIQATTEEINDLNATIEAANGKGGKITEQQKKDLEKLRSTVKSQQTRLAELTPNPSASTAPKEERPPDCLSDFNEFLAYPIVVSPYGRDVVTGSAVANLNRSPRSIGFRLLGFAADVSSVFTGLSLLGRDGVKGAGFLATAIIPAANNALPAIADAKMQNLKNTMAPGTLIIPNNDARIINVFIPADRVFYGTTWQLFKQSAGKSSNDARRLHMMLESVITASVSGVLIPTNSEKTTSPFVGGTNRIP